MHRYFIKLAYNGANYHGWQMQDNARTVQQELNEKISLMLNHKVNLVGCGRTDTGVHAREFYAHFDLPDEFGEIDDTLAFRLNAFLPPDIVVYHIFQVPQEFHARFDAKSRTYRYYISRRKDPFRTAISYTYHAPLNLEKMKEAAEILFSYDDFTSFSKLHTQTKTNICRIMEAKWEEKGQLFVFTIKADRFLRNMVRAIVGTCLEIGKGKLAVEDMQRIIEAKDRSQAGFSVPPQGLFLEKIEYDFPEGIMEVS